MKSSPLAAIAFLLGSTLRGDPVELRLAHQGGDFNEPVTLILTSKNSLPGQLPFVVSARIAAGKNATTVDLTAAEWQVVVEGDGVWHPPQFFVVRDGQSNQVTVPVWPAATLTGAVALSDLAALRSATLEFVPPNTTIPVTETLTFDEGRFVCRVPAGTLDFRLHVPGHVTRYLWGQSVPTGKTLDWGQIVVRRGSAAVGEVAAERDASVRLADIIITAVPADVGGVSKPLPSLKARADARGFFHVDGLAPGQYVLIARGGGMVSRRINVDVSANKETRLHDPLIVQRLKTLSIVIAPALAPGGGRWTVMLDRALSASRSESVASIPSAISGEAEFRGLPAGPYQLTVGPSSEETWLRRTLDVEDDQHVALSLDARTIRGRVTLGGNPLAAQLTFRSTPDSHTVETTSDDDGGFRVGVPGPKSNRWLVTVDAAAPRIHAEIADLQLEDDTPIEVPRTILEGDVVDASGKPALDVFVNVIGGDSPLQLHPQRDGTFYVNGLQPGAYVVNASGYLIESEPRNVTLPKEGYTDPVHLVVMSNRQLKGRIVSSFGPVPGALVVAVPTDVFAPQVMRATTDANGEFVTVLAPGCRQVDVFVAAPGFAYRSFHAAMSDPAIVIHVQQEGGTLTVRWNPKIGDPFLMHAGAIFQLERLAWDWNARVASSGEGQQIQVAQLEPGSYAVCILNLENRAALHTHALAAPPGETCTSTFLPPMGSATVDVTASH